MIILFIVYLMGLTKIVRVAFEVYLNKSIDGILSPSIFLIVGGLILITILKYHTELLVSKTTLVLNHQVKLYMRGKELSAMKVFKADEDENDFNGNDFDTFVNKFSFLNSIQGEVSLQMFLSAVSSVSSVDEKIQDLLFENTDEESQRLIKEMLKNTDIHSFNIVITDAVTLSEFELCRLTIDEKDYGYIIAIPRIVAELKDLSCAMYTVENLPIELQSLIGNNVRKK